MEAAEVEAREPWLDNVRPVARIGLVSAGGGVLSVVLDELRRRGLRLLVGVDYADWRMRPEVSRAGHRHALRRRPPDRYPARQGERAEIFLAVAQQRLANALAELHPSAHDQPADGAVISRRGDSLWRISRRVYGRGVRYSTIYLANQKQKKKKKNVPR